MTATAAIEKREFQAEVKQVLDLVIHSLYSHKEIFLRELISNASDAVDRARVETLTDIAKLGEDKSFKIQVEADAGKNELVIRDNGIGMTRQELIDNIGTIASSGTRKFLDRLTGDQKKDVSLIGQFGVGFYSAFMVADKVTVDSKRLGSEEPATRWTSQGGGTFTLEDSPRRERGTVIRLHIKEEEKEYLEDWKLRSVIKKYSSFVAHPIGLLVADAKDKKKLRKEEILNDKPPIWRRGKTELSRDEYVEFYKHLTMDAEEPLEWIHNKVEGILEYTLLMYIPAKAPFDLYFPEKTNGLSLYVKRIFIMNDCKDLLPTYLRFVRGIVDSEDLPLNVSREILQKNAVLQKIQKASTKKVLGVLENMARKDGEKYAGFWKEFGNVLKEGFHLNWENLDELKRLLRFHSSTATGDDSWRSLEEYVAGMKPSQKDIYYITGENVAAVGRSPHLEVFKSKGMEVLYLVDPIDEWVVQSIDEYEGKKLKNVAKGGLDLGDLDTEEKAAVKEGTAKFKKLTTFIQDTFSNKLKAVRVTTRLKDSPCCLVADETDMGANMERILKAANQQVQASKRILEINPAHPIIANLGELAAGGGQVEKLREWCGLLVDEALLAEGSTIDDPAAFVARVNSLLEEVSSPKGQ